MYVDKSKHYAIITNQASKASTRHTPECTHTQKTKFRHGRSMEGANNELAAQNFAQHIARHKLYRSVTVCNGSENGNAEMEID